MSSVLLVHPGGVKTNLMKNAPNIQEDKRELIHNNFTKFAFLDVDQTVRKILRAVQRGKKNRLVLGADAHVIWTIRRIFRAAIRKSSRRFSARPRFSRGSRFPFVNVIARHSSRAIFVSLEQGGGLVLTELSFFNIMKRYIGTLVL